MDFLLESGLSVQEIARLSQWPTSYEDNERLESLQNDVRTMKAKIKFAEEKYDGIARERISISWEWKNKEEIKPAEDASCSRAMDLFRDQDEGSCSAQLARYSPMCEKSTL
ncbi:uncharacterized protein LOC144765671 [Lissotriton helveticus]